MASLVKFQKEIIDLDFIYRISDLSMPNCDRIFIQKDEDVLVPLALFEIEMFGGKTYQIHYEYPIRDDLKQFEDTVLFFSSEDVKLARKNAIPDFFEKYRINEVPIPLKNKIVDYEKHLKDIHSKLIDAWKKNKGCSNIPTIG